MLQLVLDDFTWQRPASRKRGFTWEGSDEDPCLVHVPGAAFLSYRPDPGLFRDFADWGQSPEAILNFANRYGSLVPRLEFNTLASWRQGIQEMNRLVALSDAVAAGDWKKLPKALAPFLTDASLADASDIRPIRQKQKRRETVSRNELADAAVMRLYHAISPTRRFEAEGRWNSLSEKVELRIKYADLRSFMFFQLGHALLGGRRFRQCAACGKWSLLQPGINRADRTTCSGYCRIKLYRQRRTKAEELHRQGWSLQQIVKEIGSDVSTVKQWLAEVNEQEGPR
jgi:hypothetical protein